MRILARQAAAWCTVLFLGLTSSCGPARDEAGPTSADAVSTPAAPGTPRPNILLVSIDMLRPDHLGCYGYPRETSPRIDALARSGALFEDAVSSTSWTLPAHAALFTGLPDSVHGCTDTHRKLAANRVTLAERLKGAGYATAGFFSGPYLHPVFGLAQGFDEYVDCTSYASLNHSRAEAHGTVDGMPVWSASHADVTGPRVRRRVGEWLAEAPERQPFFLFVHLWDVHYDFIPPPPYDTRFDPDYRGTLDGRNFLFNDAIHAGMPQRDLDHLIALYDGEIAWTDEQFGGILDDLQSLGLTDSTLVVVLSDHGTEFFEHGRKSHRQTLYEESVRIPLIFSWPGHVPSRRVTTQARMVDVLPTILDLAGVPLSPEVMGRSLVAALHGREMEPAVAVSELLTRDPRYPRGHRMRSFRRPGLKLIRDFNSGTTSVFDLAADPGERLPLSSGTPGSREAEGMAAGMAQALSAFRLAMPPGEETGDIPDDIRERLRSLGYIGGDDPETERRR